jgi:hypothetical protein
VVITASHDDTTSAGTTSPRSHRYLLGSRQHDTDDRFDLVIRVATGFEPDIDTIAERLRA